jgi:hypothetical protein
MSGDLGQPPDKRESRPGGGGGSERVVALVEEEFPEPFAAAPGRTISFQ